MHLESMGEMDDYLFANPELTFFKSVYKRHTNFSQEIMDITVNGSYIFGGKVSANVPRHGDLVGGFFLEVKLSNTNTHCYGLGNALIESVELTIGGQRIEKLYGNCMNIIGELTQNDEKRYIWDKFVGNHADKDCNKLLIPLPFFCSNIENYIQLIAMSFHEAHININFASREKLMLPEDCKIESVKLCANYIYLDSFERKSISQATSEFLISSYIYINDSMFTVDQLNTISNQIIDCIGNHPTSELFWVIQNENGQPCQSVCIHNDIYAQYTININNNMKYMYKPLEYAHLYNPYAYNKNTPRTGNIYSALKSKDILSSENINKSNVTDTQTTRLGIGFTVNKYLNNGTKYNQYIYSHSFSFNPDHKTQPAGTINLSKLNQFTLELQNLKLEPGNYTITVYSKHYNILRYAGGMAGLLYAP